MIVYDIFCVLFLYGEIEYTYFIYDTLEIELLWEALPLYFCIFLIYSISVVIAWLGVSSF